MFKEFKERRADTKSFKEEVRKITLQERRKAYLNEALIKAKEEGKFLARRKPTLSRIADGITNLTKSTAKKIITPSKKGRPINPYISKKPQVPVQKPIGFEFM